MTVVYTTSNGSAVAGTDYQATSGTLTFSPGTTTQLWAETDGGPCAAPVPLALGAGRWALGAGRWALGAGRE